MPSHYKREMVLSFLILFYTIQDWVLAQKFSFVLFCFPSRNLTKTKKRKTFWYTSSIHISGTYLVSVIGTYFWKLKYSCISQIFTCYYQSFTTTVFVTFKFRVILIVTDVPFSQRKLKRRIKYCFKWEPS